MDNIVSLIKNFYSRVLTAEEIIDVARVSDTRFEIKTKTGKHEAEYLVEEIEKIMCPQLRITANSLIYIKKLIPDAISNKLANLHIDYAIEKVKLVDLVPKVQRKTLLHMHLTKEFILEVQKVISLGNSKDIADAFVERLTMENSQSFISMLITIKKAADSYKEFDNDRRNSKAIPTMELTQVQARDYVSNLKILIDSQENLSRFNDNLEELKQFVYDKTTKV